MPPFNFPFPHRPFLILALLMASLILLSGCRTKKKLVHKKAETQSELQQNDITTTNQLKEETSTFRISEHQHYRIAPIDTNRPAQVIKGQDTLQLNNATLEIDNGSTSEDITETTTNNTRTQDSSTNQSEAAKEETQKDTKTRSASWGLNLGIILGIVALGVLVFFHLQKS